MNAPVPSLPSRQLGRYDWTTGNRIKLLENGEQYFPAVFKAIREAQNEVLLETFIVFDDGVGTDLKEALIGAARNGARVVVTVDGYGTADLPPAYVDELVEAGVDFRSFDPATRLLGMRTNAFRRLHRKIVVVDRRIGFVGGINYSDDHLLDYGEGSKQDYAVEVEGPIVDDLRALVITALEGRRMPRTRPWWHRRARFPDKQADGAGGSALLSWRDNDRHRDDIELHYRVAMRHAKREIIVANAYFFPGFRLLREFRKAARRGVKVELILQGSPDQPIMRWAAQTLYDYLLSSGVVIYEYCQRPFHGKVAVIDDDWCTVGSSNLDPLSLSLNLEANLLFHDQKITTQLRARLQKLMQESCERINRNDIPHRTRPRQALSWLVFHFLRRFPAWAGWLPVRRQSTIAVSENRDPA
ncbi:MAG: cardiolipin synthase ClsB [Pseudomonadota bacterium]|nr:cardiolipin synthase ClsB [Pseudomonadota bacterium]